MRSSTRAARRRRSGHSRDGRYRRRVEGHATGENAACVRHVDRIERRLRLAGLRAERDTIYALARAQKKLTRARKLVRELDLVEERVR